MAKLEFDGAHFDNSAELAQHLIDGIRRGMYRSGHRFPAQQSMAKRIAVSRSFVALAYNRVVGSGLATSDKTNGLVVK